ncbi:Na+/H+ antiporter NhaA [Kocuria sp.]|uniref:Na+/H+ antiporter NhaA n=1 Tax=Kocuria sp. TaxID=1871328 RepID=UPI0026DFAE5A|nr:Na+/H+ antiporter NhaA [Kocuria sp.]MDO5618480.1 Na+/H+ antiporter NhaA [Kocuria sp.]
MQPSLLERLRSESGSALLLVAVTVLALLWANSPWSPLYTEIWETHLDISLGAWGLNLSLHHWVNDGLMVIFFFVVGLEVRQELAVGSLRDRRRALVPLVAGTLGVAIPAAIYLAIAGRESPAGWGAVVGTDTAFLLGALALVGPAMSNQLRIFLLTLTVVDDFLAVSIIGVFYTDDLKLLPLGIALAALVALYFLGRTRQWRSAPYVGLVIVLWLATLESGIHPSIAGMVAGLLVPAYATHRGSVESVGNLFRDFRQSPEADVARSASRGLAQSISVNERLHAALRSPSSLLIVPIFALANAGVDLRGDTLNTAMTSTVTWGVVGGLVLGKLLGISLGTWLAIRMGLGRLPDGVGPGSIMGGAALSGIGFTVSLLVIGLAFTDAHHISSATVGVLLAMVLAWLLGWLIFYVARVRFGETSADLPVTLTPPVNDEHDHIYGSVEAECTVVEYFDYQCPFCSHTTGIGYDLVEHFGDRVRFIARHCPIPDLHPHAQQAAVVAEAAARQGEFWAMHRALFDHQEQLGEQTYRTLAQEIGLDMDQFESDLQDPVLPKIVAKHARSALESGARGTPTFFLNGSRHLGPHDARTIITELEAQMATQEEHPARRRS